MMTVRKSALPKMRSAHSRSFIPKTMEIRVDAPTPTSVPNACRKVMMGKLNAKPEIAMAPAPCPMKIRSIRLYTEVLNVVITAGSAYCQSSLGMLSVSNRRGSIDVFAMLFCCLRAW